jgi:methionyl-tRNA synthetase
MVVRYCDGELPAPGEYTDADRALSDLLGIVAAEADAAIDRLDFSGAIAAVRRFVEAVNLYVTQQEPWKLAKDPDARGRLDTVLYVIAESLRGIAVLYHPVMPVTMTTMWDALGAPATLGALVDQSVADVARWGQLPPGSRLVKGAALFPRLAE